MEEVEQLHNERDRSQDNQKKQKRKNNAKAGLNIFAQELFGQNGANNKRPTVLYGKDQGRVINQDYQQL